MAKARKKHTPKLREMSPTLVSGAAEMNGAASAVFAGNLELVTPLLPQVYVVKVPPSLTEQLVKRPIKEGTKRPQPQHAEAGTLPRGRSCKYNVDAIDGIARNVAREIRDDDKFDWYVARVCVECEKQNLEYPKPTRMKEICRKWFNAARAKSATDN